MALNEAIRRVHDFLAARSTPFPHPSYDLAHACGISGQDLMWALHTIRSPQFIADNGWTVPFQPKGLGVKAWRIVTAQNPDGIIDGSNVRGPELVHSLERLHAQLALGVVGTDARTREGKLLRAWATTIDAMAQQGALVFTP